MWIGQGGDIVGRFRVAAISKAKRVTLPDRTAAASGRELVIETGSFELELPARSISDIETEPGATRNPGSRQGFVYLTKRPQRFTRVTAAVPLTPPPPPPFGVRLGALQRMDLSQWTQRARRQAIRAEEQLHHPAEGKLVRQYVAWAEIQHGPSHAYRPVIYLPDGSTIIGDLFDPAIPLLIEAKATSDRPAFRMAVGQLLDYSRHLPNQITGPGQLRCAVLVSVHPDPDLIELARSVNIDVTWRCTDGSFDGTTTKRPRRRPQAPESQHPGRRRGDVTDERDDVDRSP